MKHLKSTRGFTLIEMLIVITIIAVLASMILVGMGGARVRARDTRRIADLHNVQNGLELYFSTNGHYPAADSWTALETDLQSVGIKHIPDDPLKSQHYQYGHNGSGDDTTDYVLGAKLEEGTNPALGNDTDGTVYGIDCDDPVYCVQP